ncbi:MAG: excinuclease ABC subunit UvrC [Clostridiales bacterium]
MTDKIRKILDILPQKPGIYIMKDENLKIIYIGKAIVIRNRVRQYFQSNASHSEKTCLLVSKICDIEYIITNSEMEALILENNLIKEHKPKFNILLKDDKNYPFIKVTMKELFPRVIVTRKFKKDGSKYFGPYSQTSSVKETLKIIKDLFSIKTCSKDLKKLHERPCLNYHIKKCHGPCTQSISKEDYGYIIKQVCDFLNGNYGDMLNSLNKEMLEASNNLDFEKAALFRDKIKSLKHMLERQRVVSVSKEDQDVIVSAKDEKDVIIVVFFIRGGLLIGNADFLFKNESSSKIEEIINSFIKQYYDKEQFIPKSLILEYSISDVETIKDWLTKKRGSKVNLIFPKKGEKLDYIKMAKQNAKIILHKKIELGLENINLIKLLEKVKIILELENIPKRIEAYDISNTGISEIVGSMVVFQDGKENKSDYRRFKIKSSLDKPNDYLCMQEIIYRRFKRKLSSEDNSFSKTPDLILLDGGLGHINAVKEVLEEMNINIVVYGLVKDSKHKTRAVMTRDGEINILDDMEIFRFFSKIQNEVHRFTIDYNKNLRTKRYRESEVDNIDGVGPKKKIELIKYFGSIKKLKEADILELLKVKGINKELAEKIYIHFRGMRN